MDKLEVVCNDRRKCFAKTSRGGYFYTCSLLMENYDDGKCPFCKPERNVTKGKRYAFRLIKPGT